MTDSQSSFDLSRNALPNGAWSQVPSFFEDSSSNRAPESPSSDVFPNERNSEALNGPSSLAPVNENRSNLAAQSTIQFPDEFQSIEVEVKCGALIDLFLLRLPRDYGSLLNMLALECSVPNPLTSSAKLTIKCGKYTINGAIAFE